MRNFKTFNENDKNVDNYFLNYEELFFKNGTMRSYRLNCYDGFSEFNTFKVNNLIDTVTTGEIEYITATLLKHFPPTKSGLRFFHEVIYKSQFYTYDMILWVSDYAVFELDKYIISFHLDIFNGLDITISSIYRTKDIKKYIKKEFN